jgi:hypothetical protein
MPDELWGTFSVEDFQRSRAFVADVLLYDRLVIPFPENDDQRRLWQSWGLDVGRLERKLEILDRRYLVHVAPWSENKTARFRERLEAAEVLQNHPELRRHLLRATYQEWKGFGVTRPILALDIAELDLRGAPSSLRRHVGTFVEAIAAYPSYGDFAHDFAVHRLAADETSSPQYVHARGPDVNEFAGIFGWELFVPEEGRLSDDELLARAVELAARDDMREKRREFHQWRRQQVNRGVHHDDVLADGMRRLAEYRDSIATDRARTRTLNAFTVFSIGASLASAMLAVPPAAIGAALFTAIRFGAEQAWPSRPPDKDGQALAMFYDAQRHFGWV